MLRFGFDVGTNSIGWCVFETDGESPTALLGAGSRIFSDGRTAGNEKEPLAVGCRTARGARVRRGRWHDRKKQLLQTLIRLDLMPSDKAARQAMKSWEPLEIRARAAEQAVTAHELGRALMHMAQRRGFKSNRNEPIILPTPDDDCNVEKAKPKKESAKEKGESKSKEQKQLAEDIHALDQQLRQTGMTLGQYLYQKLLQEPHVTRARPGDHLHPLRRHYEDEFDRIYAVQASHLPRVSEQDWQNLRDILFTQLPLQAQEVGWCQVYYSEKEKRERKASPSYQTFRLWQNLVNLKIISADKRDIHPLSPAERETLYAELRQQKSMTFGRVRKLLKGMKADDTFNLENSKSKGLEGDATAGLLANDKYFGARWHDLPEDQQEEIVAFLCDTAKDDPQEITQHAITAWGVSEVQAANLSVLSPKALPTGYGRFSRRALREITERLRYQGISTTEAIQELNGNMGHNSRTDARLLDRLPYYGEVILESAIPAPKRGDKLTQRYGKINNPTVHIGLNQLRRLINDLIRLYGRPDHIVVELARDLKLNDQAKKDLDKFQKANEKLNDAAKKELAEAGLEDSGDNLRRYKLWGELVEGDVNGHQCLYCGDVINKKKLYSSEVEVDHILPESITFDSSMRNLTVCHRECNQYKRNRSPDEAFFNCPNPIYNYEAILERVSRAKMTDGKKRLFSPGALERFKNSKQGDFIARQLTDTQYLAKVAVKYLGAICNKVDVVPGKLTAIIRRQWGLNSILAPKEADPEVREQKNRNDHRHHAIDAIVIACTDRAMLKRASDAASNGNERKVLFEPPWEKHAFRARVEEVINGVTVSHKRDHGIQGRLHEDTNYGIIKNPSEYESQNGYNIVRRCDFRGHFDDIKLDKKKKTLKTTDKLAEIRDPKIRKDLEILLADAATAAEINNRVDAYAKQRGIRNIRLLKKEATVQVFSTKDETGRTFERGIVPGSNHHLALWRIPDQVKSLRGDCREVSKNVVAVWCSVLDANLHRHDMNYLKPHPAAKLLCRIHKKDIVAWNEGNQTVRYMVGKIEPSKNRLVCYEINASSAEGKKEYYITLKKMITSKFRPVFVTSSGIILDNGPVITDATRS